MKLLKNDVLFIPVYTSSLDKYGNVYSGVANAFLLRKGKRIYLPFDRAYSLHTTNAQVAREWLSWNFGIFEHFHFSEKQNIIVQEIEISFKSLKKLMR